MLATLIGKARDLSISFENGDKHLSGRATVEGGAFVAEAFDDVRPDGWSSQGVEGFISIYAAGSAALLELLGIGNKDNQYQEAIERYADLKSLTIINRYNAELFVGVMPNEDDFKYFTSTSAQ
jgi:hypothetical protein